MNKKDVKTRKILSALNIRSKFSRQKLAEFLADRFGNEKGLADAIADTYTLSPEGSATRKGILDLVLSLLIDDRNDIDALQGMTEEELKAEAEEILGKLNADSTGVSE